MKQLIIKVCLWVLKRLNVTLYPLPAGVVAILPEVNEEVEKTAAMQGLLSNEYRHSHTYATLKKRLPDSDGKNIGLAIEVVLNGTK